MQLASFQQGRHSSSRHLLLLPHTGRSCLCSTPACQQLSQTAEPAGPVGPRGENSSQAATNTNPAAGGAFNDGQTRHIQKWM